MVNTDSKLMYLMFTVPPLAIIFTSTTTATDTISVEIIGALKNMGGAGGAAQGNVRGTTPRAGVGGVVLLGLPGATCRARLYAF